MSYRRLLIGALVGLAGCGAEQLPGPDDPDPEGPNPQPSVLIVSAPVTPPLSGLSALTSGTHAYVSLPAGTVPQGVTAEIRNRGGGGSTVAYLSSGGFDPVAVPALAGDSIQLEVKSLTGAVLLRETTVVPAKRPPVIVRTNPPPRKRDVPLNASIVVIFSEPIDQASLTPQSFRLSAGGGTVSGSLALSEDGTRAEFIPGQPLAVGTTYLLSLSNLISGVGGERLEPATLEFTSAASAEGAGMSQIAYTGCPNPDATPGSCGLFVMNADGSNIRQLTEARDDNYDSSPAWSPDGREIAFTSFRHCALTGRLPAYQGGSCGREIYLMHADGSGIVRLTFAEESFRADFPAWRPDGASIAYALTGVPIGSGYGISSVGVASGTVTTVVFSTVLSFGRPAWSPDGSRLVASTSNCCIVSEAEAGLRVMNADGSGMVRITTTRDGFPSWSPDGTRIAFQRQFLAGSITSYNLFSVAPDGSGITQLTSYAYPIWPLTPAWSPDGSRIAFKRTDNASIRNSEIWVMNPDGTGARLLNPGWANLPAWSPFGTVP